MVGENTFYAQTNGNPGWHARRQLAENNVTPSPPGTVPFGLNSSSVAPRSGRARGFVTSYKEPIDE